MKTTITLLCFVAGIASAQVQLYECWTNGVDHPIACLNADFKPATVADVKTFSGVQFDHYRLLVKNGKLPANDAVLVQKAFEDIQAYGKDGDAVASADLIQKSDALERLIAEIEARK